MNATRKARVGKLERHRAEHAAPIVCAILDEGQPLPPDLDGRLVLLIHERIVNARGQEEGGADDGQDGR